MDAMAELLIFLDRIIVQLCRRMSYLEKTYAERELQLPFKWFAKNMYVFLCTNEEKISKYGRILTCRRYMCLLH